MTPVRGASPGEAALAEARGRVGAGTLLRVDEHASRVALVRPGMSIDVGGVAKGRALDVAAARLAPGMSALLSFGQSSLRAVGAPFGKPGWRVLLRRPDEGFAGVVTLRDQSLSVSGSLGQWTEIAGRRYGHVIDPRTGVPLERRLEAAVVAPDATLAEALSKALLLLGEQEGIALLESLPGVEGWLADDAGHEGHTRLVARSPVGTTRGGIGRPRTRVLVRAAATVDPVQPPHTARRMRSSGIFGVRSAKSRPFAS